jgi:two-component system OmpR family sensor kinase
MIARLPIRIRLTLAFTATLTLLVAALGALVYTRHAAGLNDAIDQGLAARSAELGPLEAGDPGVLARARLPEADETVEAVLAGGRVVDATPNTTPAALEAAVGTAAATGAGTVDARLPGFDHAVRLLVVPAGGGRLAVAGTALADRDEALAALRRELLLALVLVIGSAAALSYAFAAAALRPVERMRRRAATISARPEDGRLPVPAADDELGRLGSTLNVMIDRMRAAVDRERRFAADASHELRTPLALLRTELDLALDGEHTREELLTALRSASEETERLIHLTDDLLLLARADDDRLALHPTPLDPGVVARRTADRFALTAAEQGRAIVVRSPPDLAVTADEPALERALANLVANALQHGSGEVLIEASEAAPQLRVHDSGVAPAADELFRRFHRGPAPAAPGSGLGLAIVAAVAEAHGGSAGVSTADGHTTAWIALGDV